MKNLIFKILGCWFALALFGIVGEYTVGWEEVKAAVYVNAILIPSYFIYRYRRAKVAKGGPGSENAPKKGFFWTERNKLALYGSLWVWIFFAAVAFLWAEAGRMETTTGIVLTGLATLGTTALIVISRKLKVESNWEPPRFGPIRWDDQTKHVFYGTVKTWIRIAALALLLYLLDLWIPGVRVAVFALMVFSPLYCFLRSKRIQGVDA